MIDKKLIQYFASAVLILNLVAYFFFKVPDQKKVNEKVTLDNDHKVIPSFSRNPASSTIITNNQIHKPTIKRATLDKSKFHYTHLRDDNEFTNEVYPNHVSGYETLSNETNNVSEYLNSNAQTAMPPITTKKNNDLIAAGSVLIKKNLGPKNNKKETLIASSSTYGSSADSSSNSNTCSADIISGTFNSAIGVNLNCSLVSTIKYCVGIDNGSGCCDPLASNVTYSSNIIIGPASGNYCLSFFGESAIDGESPVYQNNYTINSIFPNLLVAHPQTYYQTTQLAGKSLITSSDFGKTGYNIGQINLKIHDPNPSAENLNCEDIVTNYVTLPVPSPLEVLTSLDVSLDNPALQIEIPLRLDQLDYGDNYITSYIVNMNPTEPLYSCSTSKIVLNDFDYFQDALAFGDPGDNLKREFTGGFSPFGFFEDDSTIYRGPAGEQSEDNSGQKLQHGMFGMFY